MAFAEFIWEAFRRTGRVGIVVVALVVLMALALPGVWAVQGLVGAFGGGTDVVSLEELGGDVLVDGVEYRAPDLTREAELFRESLVHMGTVIASIPTPTPTAVVNAGEAGLGGTPVVAALLENPGGVVIEAGSGDLDWFDSLKGLEFYRPRGGDWTPPGVREESPYRSLMEYTGYPEGVSHFADGSMVYELAVRLAYGMVEVRPNFGTPTPAMFAALASDLGWELLLVEGVPAFRVWSNFEFRAADTAEYEFAVGGVMVMRVGELSDGAQYLIPGGFVAPGVVLQRLDVGG